MRDDVSIVFVRRYQDVNEVRPLTKIVVDEIYRPLRVGIGIEDVDELKRADNNAMEQSEMLRLKQREAENGVLPYGMGEFLGRKIAVGL